jgi:phage repressor protein C with HTH and peptisase S24 domain
MKGLGKRVKQKREELGWTKVELAKRAGVSPTTISYIESGRNSGSKFVVQIAGALGESASLLATGREAQAAVQTAAPREAKMPVPTHTGADGIAVPMFEVSASMGLGNPFPDNDTVVGNLQLTDSWVRQNLPNLSSPKNLSVISAYGDSMTPTFNPGDILLADRGVNEIRIDAVYVFALNHELYIKRIQRRMDGSIVIKSDNPLFDPYILQAGDKHDMRVLGRILWAWMGKKL